MHRPLSSLSLVEVLVIVLSPLSAFAFNRADFRISGCSKAASNCCTVGPGCTVWGTIGRLIRRTLFKFWTSLLVTSLGEVGWEIDLLNILKAGFLLTWFTDIGLSLFCRFLLIALLLFSLDFCPLCSWLSLPKNTLGWCRNFKNLRMLRIKACSYR